MAESVSKLDRWCGSFPGEHEFSTLQGLERTPDNEAFFDAADRLITKWQGNQFVGLYLYGGPGVGKTHAAMGLGRELHDASGADIFYRYIPEISVSKLVTDWSSYRSQSKVNDRNNSMTSVFPSTFAKGVTRNPRTVLILDDYQPKSQQAVAAAIEAGAQYGGLVVITSNYPDPFKLFEVQNPEPMTDEAIAMQAIAAKVNPDEA